MIVTQSGNNPVALLFAKPSTRSAIRSPCSALRHHRRQAVTRTIAEALKDLTDKCDVVPPVVGTAEGLCEGRLCLKVFLAKKTLSYSADSCLLEGYPVTTEETETFRAGPRARMRVLHDLATRAVTRSAAPRIGTRYRAMIPPT